MFQKIYGHYDYAHLMSKTNFSQVFQINDQHATDIADFVNVCNL